MKITALTQLFVLLTWPWCHTASAASPAAQCDDATNIIFAHKSELPSGILSKLGIDIADKGEPFEKGCDIRPGFSSRRFMSAQQLGCRLLYVNYESGGRAYSQHTVFFDLIDGEWVLRPTR